MGTDGTERAGIAVSRAAELAARLGAELVIAFAYPDEGRTTNALGSSRDPTAALDIAKAALRDATKPLDRSFPLMTRALGGSPAKALASLAKTEGFDLVVTGNRGLENRGNWLRRSVPEGLLRVAPAHVLVVDTSEPRDPGFQRVLVGTDGSNRAASAVDLAARLAAGLRATLTIVTCAASTEAGRRALASASARYPFADTRVLSGDPAKSISRFSQEASCDVIVVGNKGMTGGRRLVLGSVAEALSRIARSDLLVAKTAG